MKSDNHNRSGGTEGQPGERFASEPIVPEPGSMSASAMSRGAPGVPRRFTWRGRQFEVVEILSQWKSTGGCRHGSQEMYVRRHWFRLHTQPEAVLTIYCDRQARQPRNPKARWFVFSYTMPQAGDEV